MKFLTRVEFAPLSRRTSKDMAAIGNECPVTVIYLSGLIQAITATLRQQETMPAPKDLQHFIGFERNAFNTTTIHPHDVS